MNENYYQNPMFPGQPTASGTPNQQTAPSAEYTPNFPPPSYTPTEQSYIENILRINKGKIAKLYFTFPDSVEWRDKTFDGVVEQSGRDHVIVSNPKNGEWYLLPLIYLDYVVYEEKINYSPIFATPPKN